MVPRNESEERGGGRDADRLAKIFKALANPNRVRIYDQLLGREAGARGQRLSEVVRTLRIGAPTVSHHLKELVNAELVTAERDGRFVVCRINPRTREIVRTLFR